MPTSTPWSSAGRNRESMSVSYRRDRGRSSERPYGCASRSAVARRRRRPGWPGSSGTPRPFPAARRSRSGASPWLAANRSPRRHSCNESGCIRSRRPILSHGSSRRRLPLLTERSGTSRHAATSAGVSNLALGGVAPWSLIRCCACASACRARQVSGLPSACSNTETDTWRRLSESRLAAAQSIHVRNVRRCRARC